jgi:hypothetical protein
MTKVLYHGILSYGFGRNYNHLRSMLIEILIYKYPKYFAKVRKFHFHPTVSHIPIT